MSTARTDTRKILRVATWLLIAGTIGAVLVPFAGGATHHGPRTGLGWFGMMLAFCTIPLGLFGLLLGLGKLREDRRR